MCSMCVQWGCLLLLVVRVCWVNVITLCLILLLVSCVVGIQLIISEAPWGHKYWQVNRVSNGGTTASLLEWPGNAGGLVGLILQWGIKGKTTPTTPPPFVSLSFIFLSAVEANKYWASLPTQKAAAYLSPSWAVGVAVPVLCCCCGVIQCHVFSLTPHAVRVEGHVYVRAGGRCPC